MPDAIVVRYARKRYGTSSPVLDGLNMTVPRGCIYGLLGASGCGKTTLLSCVVGVKNLDSGEIWVLGGKPGRKDSGIPGPRVGYMPQEISLVQECSVIGALYYFGRINGLEDHIIDERYTFFADLLSLPPKDQLIKHMSGGQQRRVSFAAALMHKPELLILDEPTVGLDPIMRENIWNFLVKITREEGTAVVITTHYIEETKQANRIGLLRCGQLLAETTPTKLLHKFQCSTLEEAFLILSQKQNENLNNGSAHEVSRDLIDGSDEVVLHSIPAMPNNNNNIRNSIECIKQSDKQPLEFPYVPQGKSKGSFTGRIFKALMIKNLLQFLRHPGGILFAFVFPIVQTTAFFYAIGRDPKDIAMAIVNDEAGHCDYGNYLGKVVYDPGTGDCDYVDISCRFLHGFDKSIMSKHHFNTIDEAMAEVKNGKAAGTMYFARNFSINLQNRRDDPNSLSNEEIIASSINTTLDMGDRQIALFLQKSMYMKFLEVYADVVSECAIPRKYVDLPLHFEKPIYGRVDSLYSDFVAPGFVLTLVFFLATAVSSSIIIADRAEGVWDRSLVQGVTTTAILFSHIITQVTMVIVQVTVVLIIAFWHFDLVCKGNFSYVIALTLLTGFCGMCYGFLISSVCNSHTVANFIATGSFYPIILLCGSIWPLESMPKFLQYVSFTLPTTIPSYSLRSVLEKGFTMEQSEIYSGFLVVTTWTTGFIVCCLVTLKRKAL